MTIDPERGPAAMSAPSWERVVGPLDRRRVVYWSLPLSGVLRSAVVREGEQFRWKVYQRPEPRFAWSMTDEGLAGTLRAAQRAGERAARVAGLR